MGRPKSLIGDPPWALRVATALTGAGADPVVLLGGDPEALRPLSIDIVADRWPGEGPLAAIATLASHSSGATSWIVAACDLPELTASDVSAVLGGLSLDELRSAHDPAVAAPVVDGRAQWSLLVVNPAALGLAVELVERGERTLRSLADPIARLVDVGAGHGLEDVDE